jgi:hypothetical protein
MQPDDSDAWHDSWLATVQVFANATHRLNSTNPWPDRPLLPQSLIYLATELWDRGFTAAQITDALAAAIAELPGYVGDLKPEQ